MKTSRPAPIEATLPTGTDALLAALLAEMRGLRRDLAALSGAQACDGAADFLLAVSDAIGSRLFTAAELLAHADLATSTQLRLAIAATG